MAYTLFLLYFLVIIDIIFTVTVVIEAYYCEYVGNICPRLDLVLCLGWLASVCLSETEGFTSCCCCGAGLCIGALWISYYCTDTYESSSGSGEFSLVAQP